MARGRERVRPMTLLRDVIAGRSESDEEPLDPRVGAYHRNAAVLTTVRVAHEIERRDQIARISFWDRKKRVPALAAEWHRQEAAALAEAQPLLAQFELAVLRLETALSGLAALERPRLFGKVEDDLGRVARVKSHIHEAAAELAAKDFGAAGRKALEAERDLFGLCGILMTALAVELRQAAYSRERRQSLQLLLDRRQAAERTVAEARQLGQRETLEASFPVYHLLAETLEEATAILASQPARRDSGRRTEDRTGIAQPQDLETLDAVGGIDATRAQVETWVRGVMGNAEGSAQGSQNALLLHGPAGSGKTLLARATAGECGLRLMRFSPATLASVPDPAREIRDRFVKAADAVPCLLLLEEFEVLGARRDLAQSIEQREITQELINCLDEFRTVHGLVVVAETQAPDQLDPALREGRFETRIEMPAPDSAGRAAILEIVLRKHPDVSWPSIDIPALGARTEGWYGGALDSLVVGAAERATERRSAISQSDLVAGLEPAGAQREASSDQALTWHDVVIPIQAETRLKEILNAFQHHEIGRRLGVQPPVGILLHGPAGTGKTTIAKALAGELKASFHEQSGPDLLNRHTGDPEERLKRLFAKARAARPAIVFIDEIDVLLRRRGADPVPQPEDRVVSQFTRELDALAAGLGILVVGATNRFDLIEDGVRERRLTPVEIPLPDQAGRLRLLQLLCREVHMSHVDLAEVAAATDGMSGADLLGLRNLAGMKALLRASSGRGEVETSVRQDDFRAALAERHANTNSGRIR